MATPIGLRIASIVRPVMDAAKKGDDLAAAVIQAMSDPGLDGAERSASGPSATVQSLAAVADGPERTAVMKTVVRDVDPVALHLQMAADHQAGLIAPGPPADPESAEIRDGHVIRI